jgi:hypothetical protein
VTVTSLILCQAFRAIISIMRKGLPICVFLAAASIVFAQTDANSITVVASRSTTTLQAPPDQTQFNVSVISGINASLDDVLGVLRGLGITAANLSSLSSSPYYVNATPNDPQASLQWSFTLSVPLSKLKDTISTLTTLQQSVAKKNNGFIVTFYLQGTQVSQQTPQPQTCALTDLIADARAQAQKLADAAGLGVGVILAMSSTTVTAPSSISYVGVLGATSLSPCSLTVKFALQRF